MSGATTNPIAAPWSGPFGGVPPWDHLGAEHFPGAFETALAERQREVEAIAANPDAPTFENTFAAFERSGRTLDRVSRMFTVARQNVTTPAYQALAAEWLPKVAAAWDVVLFDKRLFARIEAVHASLEGSSLEADQKRLVTLVHRNFVRHGARLTSESKAQLTAINQELESLFAEFRAKVLADENTCTPLTSDADLAGLSEALVESFAAVARERGVNASWAVPNTRSSVDPFLTFSARRDLREIVWRTFKKRGDNNDANDTKAVIVRIVALRAQRAALLGYPSHAHWRLSDTMARTPEAARALMTRVWPQALAGVASEVADIGRLAATEGVPPRIEPWDYLYFAEKIREEKYALDQVELAPYFELDNMVSAAIWSAEERYGFAFTEITGQVPVFHPDVRVWNVTDGATGEHHALFYLDNFARPGKRSGAWAGAYRDQSRFDGPVTAIVANNNNFVKSAPGEPVFISLDDVRTLFHEFGHALHDLLQDLRYPGLAYPPIDFIEFPSQINEEWVLTDDILARFARHADTDEPLPRALVEKVHRARRFNQGYGTVEYLACALLDMELHTRPDAVRDVSAFEQEALSAIDMPREIALRHRLPHFDHLFGSDYYSAAYYSYMWAEVLSADAWQAFKERGGPWDRSVLERLRTHLLSDGDTVDRAEAYRRFRGRDPDVMALLHRRGLPGQIDV